MLNNGKNNCGFADEIVSYIYDEMPGAERLKFESHLSGCSVCTDEFAAISDARFSVFEWQKEEFGHLPTPDIVIPYEPARNIVEETESVGLLAGLLGWLQPLPLAAAAGLIVFLGVGFFILRSIGPSEQHVASNNIVQPADAPKTVQVQSVEPTIKAPEVVAGTTDVRTTSNDIRPVKAVVHRQPVSERQVLAKNPIQRNSALNAQTAPVLSSYEDNADNSLRLADLLDDTDG